MRKTSVVALFVLISCWSSAKEVFTEKTHLMGVGFAISVVHDDASNAALLIQQGFDEIKRIEQLISSWDPNSQTSEINRNAGIRPVKVDEELFNLIERSLKISHLSNGYFDISFASIHKIWNFESFNQSQLPSEAEIAASIQLIDYRNIQLNREDGTVFLTKEGMRIGFGAIGKGYAANIAKQLLVSKGVEAGVVNASGDLLSWGLKPDGKSWKFGVQDPFHKNEMVGYVNATDMAVVTSGNYERFIEMDGVRYCHIIDPKSGWPVTALSSVTIITADAEIADALATTVFVLGTQEGLKLINHLDGVECIIVDEKGEMYLSEKAKNVIE